MCPCVHRLLLHGFLYLLTLQEAGLIQCFPRLMPFQFVKVTFCISGRIYVYTPKGMLGIDKALLEV